MKKLCVSLKFKKFNKHRSLCEVKRKRRFKLFHKNENKKELGKPREIRVQQHKQKSFSSYHKVVAPRNLSLIDNTERTVHFLNIIQSYFEKRQKVFVDLIQVNKLSYDTIVVLLSVMIQFRSHKIDFNGNFPVDKIARRALINSQFLSQLYNKVKDVDQYEVVASDNSIVTHAQKGVDPKLSEKLIERSSQTIWGEKRRCTGLQRIFIELMTNTNNHAVIGQQGEKHWWISMNHDKHNKKVSFSFIDYGVGIFNSLNNKQPGSKFHGWRQAFIDKFKASKNDEFIQLILTGELHKTVTGKSYRGKGLPGIYESYQKNQISKLYIITNDTFADVANNQYYKLSNKLSGTFVYWVLSEENENKPWNQLN